MNCALEQGLPADRAMHGKTQWPLAQYSRFVECRGVRWHVQQLGSGPSVLLLHGTGSSTHSWRDIALPLSATYQVVMCDLPGHGFTSQARRAGMSLAGMSHLLAELLRQLNTSPVGVVGHSAGAALCCQMVLAEQLQPRCIVGINAALQPFHGLAGQVFSPLAQLLSINPVVPRLVSWRAKKQSLTERLLSDTGSTIDAYGRTLYQSLLRDPKHVSGALGMMAHWELAPLWQQLPQLNVPLHLIVGANDKTVSPRQAVQVQQRVKATTVTRLEALGHLAHEEAPQQISRLLQQILSAPCQSPAPANEEIKP
jgi:magnesium chelatase accessory protein